MRPALAALLVSLAASAVGARELQFVDTEGGAVANVVVEQVDAAGSTDNATPVMDQVDKQFVPRVLVVNAGQSVAFPNSDNIRHHVYSFSSPKVFEIKLFSGSEAAPVMFDVPGIVVLGCNIHDHMVGYIYVSENHPTVISDRRGKVSLPDGEIRVAVWHPRLSNDRSKRLMMTIGPDQSQVSLELMAEKPDSGKRKFKSRFYRGG